MTLAVSLQLKPWVLFLYRNHSLKPLYSRAFKCKLSGDRRKKVKHFHCMRNWDLLLSLQVKQKTCNLVFVSEYIIFQKQSFIETRTSSSIHQESTDKTNHLFYGSQPEIMSHKDFDETDLPRQLFHFTGGNIFIWKNTARSIWPTLAFPY